MPPGVTEVPSHIDEQLRFHHQMNIEAQRELLLHRGFPISHPLVSGEIPLHPELLGQLHFDVPSRTTLPLSPEDYRRFLPEQRRTGMQSAFPLGVLPEPQDKKVARQLSRRETSNNRENSFVSLPYEDMQRKKTNSRSKSSDSRESKPKPFSLFQGGPPARRRESGGQVDQQWIMKEKNELKSLPSLTHADSGNNNMTRNDKKRASFGMILKDKFQRNPNMYFPDTQNNNTKLGVSEKMHSKTDSLSDTDTLIHNMSEGSFDKSSHNSNSIGSNKSCSSGKSSVSHDSMNGTPRMRRKTESITTPTEPAPTALLLPSNPSVILNKKTIRNYTPTESTNMLRQFEGGYRQTSLERKAKSGKTQDAADTADSHLNRKSSMEQLIEDFHKNLPPPPPVTRNTETSLPFSDGDSIFSGAPESSLSDPRAHQVAVGGGTVTSQTSNWSVASSLASFDYHSVNSIDKRRGGGTKRKEQTNLPSLTEVDRESPRGERVPPEGAPSPNPTLQRGKEKDKASQAKSSPGKEVVADLMKSTENDEELSMLHKLISEGRISGLNEKPPMFTPPTPPSKGTKTRNASESPAPRTRPAPQSPSPNKSPTDASPPLKSVVGSSSKSRTSSSVPPKSSPSARSGDRPRKNREAPKPPPTQPFKPPPATNEIKFLSGRRINSEESVNDAGDDSWRGGSRPKKDGRSGGSVQRSTSMHNTRGESLPHRGDHDRRGRIDENTENCDAEDAFCAAGSDGVFPMQAPLKMLTSVIAEKNSKEEIAQDAALAQLIADSTEKKFKLNSLFKGMWKKKHYSFDLS